MRLKLLTTAGLLVGFGLLIAFPQLVGPRPAKGASKRVYADYSRRTSWVVGGFVVCLITSGVGAVLIIREARKEYREQATRNMHDLLEAARQDVLNKANADRS